MMHMTFYWGRRVTILFDSWKTDSWLSYFLSLFACFLFSVFYQYMEDRRLRLKLLSVSKTSPPPSAGPSLSTPLLLSKMGARNWSPSRFAGGILFGINAAIGYLLMLAIMSFNAGVFIAVVVGLGVGYLVFRGGDEGFVVVDNPCACA
ncbi:copper transporter 5 [Sesamum indicum]|uniref:Copper transport protein n=1 Tax=Sesamum indicum TaxID=4182 RepID=A0A6I9TKV8_SESIN|nr:copper transporter 5 [Sesamum indicum]